MSGSARLGLAGVATIAACACTPPPTPPFDFVMIVESDPGKPLGGATVLRDNASIATTGVDGRAKFSIAGREGDIVEVKVACPPGFAAPSASTRVRLARLGGTSPEYSATCSPMSRSLVVAVRADDGGNLPIYFLTQQVAKTDASGAAHILFPNVKPGDTVTLTIDGSADPSKITPPKDSFSYTVKAKDEVVPYYAKFHREKVAAVHYVPRPHPAGGGGIAVPF